MNRQIYEQYTSSWHEIKFNAKILVADIIRWCENHDSSKSYWIDNTFIHTRRIRFQDKEDAMMFVLTWVDTV